MNKTIKILSTVVAIIFMSSFAEKHANDFIGTYGVSSSDPAQIKLSIHPDHTFYYQDYSSGNKMAITGNWHLKGNKVVLMKHGAKMKFHDVWSFAENGQVAKSRKGLNFYRLCKIEGE